MRTVKKSLELQHVVLPPNKKTICTCDGCCWCQVGQPTLGRWQKQQLNQLQMVQGPQKHLLVEVPSSFLIIDFISSPGHIGFCDPPCDWCVHWSWPLPEWSSGFSSHVWTVQECKCIQKQPENDRTFGVTVENPNFRTRLWGRGTVPGNSLHLSNRPHEIPFGKSPGDSSWWLQKFRWWSWLVERLVAKLPTHAAYPSGFPTPWQPRTWLHCTLVSLRRRREGEKEREHSSVFNWNPIWITYSPTKATWQTLPRLQKVLSYKSNGWEAQTFDRPTRREGHYWICHIELQRTLFPE